MNAPGFDQVLAAQIGIEPLGDHGFRVVWLGKTITFNRHAAEEANWNDALEWCLAVGERLKAVLGDNTPDSPDVPPFLRSRATANGGAA